MRVSESNARGGFLHQRCLSMAFPPSHGQVTSQLHIVHWLPRRNWDQLKIRHGSLDLDAALLLTWLGNRKTLSTQPRLALFVCSSSPGTAITRDRVLAIRQRRCQALLSYKLSPPCPGRTQRLLISHQGGIQRVGTCIHSALGAWRSRRLGESSWLPATPLLAMLILHGGHQHFQEAQ